MNYHLTARSENPKTGPIPVSITARESCPPSCPFLNAGCYAKNGPLVWNWQKVTDGRIPHVLTLAELCAKIARFAFGQLWRHNQAGDLPGLGNDIDIEALRMLTAANHGKRGFTYTHKPLTEKNRVAIAEANRAGFTINLSANNPSMADDLKAFNIAPVVVVVKESTPPVSHTPAGNKIVICPAQQKDSVTCASCKLCSLRDRTFIIGFRAHGMQKNKVEAII